MHPSKAIALAAVLLAMLFPAAMLAAPSVAKACFALLLVCGVALLLADPRRQAASLVGFLRAHWLLCLSFAALPAAILLQAIVSGDTLRVPYTYERLGLFFLLAWTLLQVPQGWLHRVRLGWFAGVAIAAVWLTIAFAADERPQHVGQLNLIPFTDLSLLLGALALFAIGWPPARRWRLLGALGGACGLYVAFESGTRGSWLALPLLAALALLLLRGQPRRLQMAVCAAVVLTVSIGAFKLGDGVAARARLINDDLIAFSRGDNLDSSVGNRLQLWRASWRIFADHPLTGTGLQGFRPALREEAAQGRLTPTAATYDHSHNEVLFALATLGLPGLVAVLMLWAAPLTFFARRLNCADVRLRSSAAMGVALCGGHVIFCLTEVLTIVTVANAFYVLTSALLVADIVRHEAAT